MFLTDLSRNSISRRVAMFLAFVGAAPNDAGRATARAREFRTSMVLCWALLADSGKFGFVIETELSFNICQSDLVRLIFSNHIKMADEPLFDPSLKKRKKKNVVFIEDPLGADADPTKPAPETIDSTTINGEAVDLGPTTAHELMKGSSEKEEEDFKAMFGDMKKKKKKKEIPMDFVRLLGSFIAH
jgi:hypothetical protein